MAAAAFVAASVVAVAPAEAELPDPADPTPRQEPAGPAAGEEIVSERTAQTSTYATKVPGRFRTVVAQEAINYREGGSWKRIDTALSPNGSGDVTNGSNAFDLTIAGSTGGQVARVSFAGGRSVGWSLGDAQTSARGFRTARSTRPKAVRAKAVGSRSMRYAGAIPGVTVELDSTSTGVKETLVLASSDVPDVYRFPLELRGLTAKLDAAGDVELRGADGSLVAEIPRGWMVDSSGETKTEQAPVAAVTYALVPDGSGQALEVHLDRRWLDDPARVYPVRLDPTLAQTSDPYNDTKIVALVNNQNYSGGDQLQIGKDALYQRSLVRFDLDGMNDEARVLSAGIKLHLEGAGTCQPGNAVTVRPITVANWKNNPASTGNPANTFPVWPGPATSGTVAAAQQCPSGGDPWLRLSDDNRFLASTLAAKVQSWISSPTTNYGVVLQAASETTTMTLNLRVTSANSTSATFPGPTWGPQLEILWEEGTYLRVSGDDRTANDSQVTPVTYTDFTGGENCYPEYTQPAPPGWGNWPKAAPSWWGGETQCKLDLYWKGPPTANQKTAIVAHGGGWVAIMDENGRGRRTDEEPSRVADALAERGYLVAVIDYRQTLLDFVTTHPSWPNDGFLLLSHCVDRFEQDGHSPKGLPAPAAWVPDPGKPALPAECAPLNTSDYDDLLADPGLAFVTDAAADLQQAVKWLRTDPDGVLAGKGLDPGKVFAVGESAGAINASTANFDPDSTAANDMRLDGAVAMATGHLADERAIADPARPMLPATGANAAAPLQIQIYEYDAALRFAHPPTSGALETAYTGTFDLSRQAAAHLRSLGYTVDLKVRAGVAHTPESDEKEQFNDAIGEAVAFMNSLDAGTALDTPQWFAKAPASGDVFDERVGQEMIDDQITNNRTRTGDFNGDHRTDILWWAPGNYLGAIWFAQADGTFARADASYPVSGDSTRKRLIPVTDDPRGSKDWMARYIPEEIQGADDAITGDFDGDGFDDIYWLDATTPGGNDLVWYGNPDPYTGDMAVTSTFTEGAGPVTGDFEQVLAGDFDGDGADDLYFYENSGTDELRYGPKGTRTWGTTAPAVTSVSSSPDGYSHIEVGNFDGDLNASTGLGIDDLIFTGAAGGVWTSRYGTSAPGTVVTPVSNPGHTPAAFTDVVSGNWNGKDGGTPRLRKDLFFYDAASTSHTIWYADTSTRGKFSPVTMPVATDPPEAPAPTPPTGPRQLVVGYFDNDPTPCDYDPCEDIILVSPTGSDVMLAGRSNWFKFRGFTQRDMGDVVGPDRRGIVGRFGDPDTDFDQDDLLWHYFGTDRYDAGPGSGWPWRQDGHLGVPSAPG